MSTVVAAGVGRQEGGWQEGPAGGTLLVLTSGWGLGTTQDIVL